MTVAPRPAVLLPARVTSPVVTAVVASGLLHLLWWRFVATAGGDLAAQDAWAAFARSHPDSAYNLAWYGGIHPVSYSVLSPYVMAVLGVRPTMVAAGTASAGLLAWLLLGRGDVRRWPAALYGSFALVGNAVSGRVTFALGTMFALAALCVVFAWWRPTLAVRQRWLRGCLVGICAALATASSPIAGLFLGLVGAALWLQRRRAAAYALGIPPLVVVATSAVLFPFRGVQPMAWTSTILPVIVAVLVLVLVPAPWRLVRVAAGVYIVGVLLAWLVPSPVGTNVTRLGLLFGGVVLVAAATVGGSASSTTGRHLGRRPAGVLLAAALLTSTIWQVATAARDAVQTSPPASFRVDLAPILAELRSHDANLGRVEVVPTRSHREAAAIAPYVPLARGWNRQADAERNPVFYRDRRLTPAAYRRWLHRWAVRYVVLADATPDPAAVAERRLVAGGVPYLRPVWSDGDWTLYAVRNPAPLVSPPARVAEYGAAELTLRTPRPARIVVRIASSPWLSLVDRYGVALPASAGACLSDLEAEEPGTRLPPGADNWLVLHAPRAGTYRVAAPYKLPRGTTCTPGR